MRLINSEVTSTFKVLEMKSRMKKIGEMLSFQIFGGSKFMALKLMKTNWTLSVLWCYMEFSEDNNIPA